MRNPTWDNFVLGIPQHGEEMTDDVGKLAAELDILASELRGDGRDDAAGTCDRAAEALRYAKIAENHHHEEYAELHERPAATGAQNAQVQSVGVDSRIPSEEEIARAIKTCLGEFRDPVYAYIEGESRGRWNKEHPEQEYDEPDDVDWELESYKIIARAVLSLLKGEK